MVAETLALFCVSPTYSRAGKQNERGSFDVRSSDHRLCDSSFQASLYYTYTCPPGPRHLPTLFETIVGVYTTVPSGLREIDARSGCADPRRGIRRGGIGAPARLKEFARGVCQSIFVGVATPTEHDVELGNSLHDEGT